MSLRGAVTGADSCTANGAGPSNAVAGLADTLLGTASKTRSQLHEVCCTCRSTFVCVFSTCTERACGCSTRRQLSLRLPNCLVSNRVSRCPSMLRSTGSQDHRVQMHPSTLMAQRILCCKLLSRRSLLARCAQLQLPFHQSYVQSMRLQVKPTNSLSCSELLCR